LVSGFTKKSLPATGGKTLHELTLKFSFITFANLTGLN